MRMPSTILGTRLARPLMRVGSAASVCWDAIEALALGEEERLDGAIDPGPRS